MITKRIIGLPRCPRRPRRQGVQLVDPLIDAGDPPRRPRATPAKARTDRPVDITADPRGRQTLLDTSEPARHVKTIRALLRRRRIRTPRTMRRRSSRLAGQGKRKLRALADPH